MKQSKLFGSDEVQVCNKIPLDIARALSEQVLTHVSKCLNPCEVVGSIRRSKPYCKDIDIVGVGSLEDAVKALCKHFKVEFKVKGPKVTKLYIETELGKVQIDLYCATPQTFGIHKLIRTGSAEHNMWLASYAIKNGFRLKYSEGLLKDRVVVAGKTEAGVFEALGLECPEPEKREIVEGKPLWFLART